MPALKPAIVGTVAILLFVLPFSIFASVRINEFSPQTNPEWVELNNPDDQQYSMSQITIYFDAKSDTSQKMSFCDNTVLSGKSFLLITRPVDSYWLSNSGDTIIIKKEDDVIDTITFGSGQPLKAPTGTQSATRQNNGEWVISDNASPQGEQANFLCPTPSPSPTNLPTPTSPEPSTTNTPTSTSKPTNTSTPKPTATPTQTPSEASQSSGLNKEKEDILGAKTENESTSSVSMGRAASRKVFIITFLFIGIGCAGLSLAIVLRKQFFSS